jgi:hypothetical protein
MLSLGNYQVGPDKFRERGYSGFIEYALSEKLAIGLSSMILQSKAGPYFNPTGHKLVRGAHGVTVRSVPVPDHPQLVVMAEVDLLKQSEAKWGYAGFVQGDYEVFQGLHGMLTLEAVNSGVPESGVTLPGAGELRMGYWATANWFLYDHLDLRLDLLLRGEAPTQVLTQLHYYF